MDRLFTSRLSDYHHHHHHQNISVSIDADLSNDSHFSYNQILPSSTKSLSSAGAGAGYSGKCNAVMGGGEEDDDYSSSMRHLQYQQFMPSFKEMMPRSPPAVTAPAPAAYDSAASASASAATPEGWAAEMILECARAMRDKDTSRAQQMLWMLNELSSAYGDCDQKLGACFLQALLARLTGTGPRRYAQLRAAADGAQSFDSARRLMLKFHECSPWTAFGHAAANGAILEAFEGETRPLHIVDVSDTFCTQWPTLLEALATRASSDDTPHLRLTAVHAAPAASVMREVGARMQKFARLMGVPFQFRAVPSSSSGVLPDTQALQLRGGEAVAVNCVQSLHLRRPGARDATLAAIRDMLPKVVTVTEEHVDLTSEDVYERAAQALRFFGAYLDSLDESFPRTSNERLMLERSTARSLVNVLAASGDAADADPDDDDEDDTRETASSWAARLSCAGFVQWPFSDDVVDDVRALLKRYKPGWTHLQDSHGLFLAWKDQPLVWTSAWKPDD